MSSSPSMSNFHLPLPPDLEEMLRDEARCTGQPATAVAREALRNWLTQRQRQRRYEEIAAWAAEHAGTDLDLDRDLESAGLEVLEGTLDRSKLTSRIGSLPDNALRAVEDGLRAAVDLA